MTADEIYELCDEAAAKLGEHVDAVQIMVTWVEGGVTLRAKAGVGNVYARLGMAHEFINEDRAQDTADRLGAVIHDEDEEDDD